MPLVIPGLFEFFKKDPGDKGKCKSYNSVMFKLYFRKAVTKVVIYGFNFLDLILHKY